MNCLKYKKYLSFTKNITVTKLTHVRFNKYLFFFLILSILIQQSPVFAADKIKIVNSLMENGLKFFNKGKFNEAIKIYKKVIDIDPKAFWAHYQLGTMFFRLRQLEKSIVYFKNANKIDPKHLGVYMNLAIINEFKGELSLALRYFRKVESLAKNKNLKKNASKKANSVEGDLLFNKGDLDGAYVFYKAVKKSFPNDIHSVQRLGQIYGSKTLKYRALKEFDALLKISPKDFRARVSRGIIYKDLGAVQKAKDDFVFVIDKGKETKESETAIYELNTMEADTLIESGDINKAIENYENILKVSPSDTNTLFELAYLNSKVKKPFEAIKLYEKLIKIDPSHLKGQFNLGLMYALINENKKAIDQYNNVLNLGGDEDVLYATNLKKLFLEALMLYKSKDYKGSLEKYNEIIKIEDNNYLALNNSGEIYYMLKDYKNMSIVFNQLIKIQPEEMKHREKLAAAYELLGDNENYIKTLTDLAENHPNTSEGKNAKERLLTAEGDRLMDLNNLIGALKSYQGYAAKNPDNILLRFKISNIYFKMKKMEEAIKELLELLFYHPEESKLILNIAKGFEDSGMVKEAMKYYSLVLMLKKDESDNNIAKRKLKTIHAESAHAKGNLIGAALLYENLLEEFPGYNDGRIKLSKIYVLLKKYDKAADQLEMVVKIDPRDKVSLLSLAGIYEKTKQIDRAIKNYLKGFSLTKEKRLRKNIGRRIHILKGNKLLREGDSVWALREFLEILRIFPSDQGMLIKVGKIYSNNNKLYKAKETFEKVIKLDYNSIPAHYELGNVLSKMKKTDEAIKEFEFLSIMVDDKKLIRNVSRKLYVLRGDKYTSDGDNEKAVEEYEKILELSAESPLGYYKVGISRLKLEQFEKARESFLSIIELEPDNLYGHYYLGTIYRQLEDDESAIKEYETLKSIDKDNRFSTIQNTIDSLKRKNFFNYSMGYNMTFDNNTNQSSDQPIDEIYSTYNFGLNYSRKMLRKLRASIRTNSNFSTNYISQTTSFSLGASPNLALNFRTFGISLGYNLSLAYSGGSPSSLSTSYSLSNNITLFKYTRITLGGNYSYSNPYRNPTSKSRKFRGNLALNQQLYWIGSDSFGLSYNYSVAKFVRPEGKRSDNNNQTFSFFYKTVLFKKVSANFNYSANFLNFENPDPITNTLTKRTVSSFSYSLSYSFPKSTSLSIRYVRTISRSNAVTGVPLDLEAIIANRLQTEEIILSRGKYNKDVVAVSLNISF